MEMVRFAAPPAARRTWNLRTISYVVNEQRREMAIASRWELKEALSSRWSCAGDSVWPPRRRAGLAGAPHRLSPHGGCSTACRRPICPPSLGHPCTHTVALAASISCAARHAPRSNHYTPLESTSLALLETCLRNCGHPKTPCRGADEFTPTGFQKMCPQNAFTPTIPAVVNEPHYRQSLRDVKR